MLSGECRLSSKCGFNIDRQSIMRNGHEYTLSSIEFRILLELVRHVNEPVSAKVIIQQIWNGQPSGSRGNLNTYINRLRGHLGNRRLIVTLHDIGYMLVPEKEL